MFLQESDILDLLPLGDSSKLQTPEKSLLLALLQRAMIDLLDKDPKVREEVFDWFTAPHADNWGTYYHVCIHLEFEPVRLRERILKLAQKNYLKPTSILKNK